MSRLLTVSIWERDLTKVAFVFLATFNLLRVKIKIQYLREEEEKIHFNVHMCVCRNDRLIFKKGEW